MRGADVLQEPLFTTAQLETSVPQVWWTLVFGQCLGTLGHPCPASGARPWVGDKGFDTARFVNRSRELGITAHVARKLKGSAVDGRTLLHAGYTVSQRKRKRIEEPFG